MNNYLTKLIQSVDYVSFDIFNTLVFRKVNVPTDVFIVVKKIYEMRYGLLHLDYPAERIKAEKLAREKTIGNSRRPEITLKDIYEELEHLFADKTVCNKLMLIELEAEYDLSTINDSLTTVYEYCRKNSKQIIISSDMYLPVTNIRKILHKNGYIDYFKLYLSSELMKTKSSGSMYDYIANDLGVDTKAILHIGDNATTDIYNANRKGFKTYHYKKLEDKSRKIFDMTLQKHCRTSDDMLASSILMALDSNKYYSSVDAADYEANNFWYIFGYKNIGILYYAFIKWLIAKAKEDKIEQLYFLARDGYIMKKVYDIMSAGDQTSPPSKYIYASRRSFNVPAISKVDNASVDFLLSYSKHFPISQILFRIGLDPKTYLLEIKAAGFSDPNEHLDSEVAYTKARKLLISLGAEIKKNSILERRYILKYLEQEDLFIYNNVAIVDLGWQCTLQKSLLALLNSSGRRMKLKGYYFGTFEKAKEQVDANKIVIDSYLCKFAEPKDLSDIIKLSVEVFELIYRAPHASVIRFVNQHRRAVPVFADNDSSNMEVHYIMSLQRGALDFIADFIKINKKYDVEISKRLAIAPFQRMLKTPTYTEATAFGNFQHATGFGGTFFKRHIALPPRPSIVLGNPNDLLRNYHQSFWKSGYRKRLLNPKWFLA